MSIESILKDKFAELKDSVGGSRKKRRTRGRKSRGRKSRGRKSRGRKSGGRKSRKHRGKRGGNLALKAAAVPFGLLALKTLAFGKRRISKRKGRKGSKN